MIIDTNVYSSLTRGVTSAVDAVSAALELKLPLPVIAELRFGFVKGSRYEENEKNLERFLAQPQVVVVSPTIQTTNLYAELGLLCFRTGRALSQNDVWIAALAKETGDTLVTFDKDFEALREVFGEKLLILE